VASQPITRLRRRAADLLSRGLPRGGTGRNAAWVLSGQAIGLLVTLIATPIQLDHMGAERYGIVVITAAALNSLMLLDGGAGLAVLRAVPWHRARGDTKHARSLAASGLLLTLAVGSVVGAVVWLLADHVVDVFRISESARPDAVAAFRVAAFILPLSLGLGVLLSLARSAGLFWATAASSAFVMSALNITWAAVAGESHDVVLVAKAQFVITLVAVTGLLIVLAIRARDYLFPLRPSLRGTRELMSFGGRSAAGMASLSALNQADKVALAAVLPVSTLPAYSIPFSIALRITVVSSSLAGVLLPRLAAMSSTGDVVEVRRVGLAALKVISLGSAAIAVTCAFAGGAFLELWVGGDFADDAWGPLIALAVGFGALATGSVGGAMLDASGRPGTNAAMTTAGAALGLGLGVGLAAAFGTALAAAIGIATGLVVIGAGALELSRRLVLRMSWRALAPPVLTPWVALGAAAALAYGLSRVASMSPLVTIALVALAAAAAATGVAYGSGPWRSRLTT
jgi:O-antigen/teichoic acid export membrane protein